MRRVAMGLGAATLVALAMIFAWPPSASVIGFVGPILFAGAAGAAGVLAFAAMGAAHLLANGRAAHALSDGFRALETVAQCLLLGPLIAAAASAAYAPWAGISIGASLGMFLMLAPLHAKVQAAQASA